MKVVPPSAVEVTSNVPSCAKIIWKAIKKPQSQSGIHLLVLDMTNQRFENVGQSVLRDGWATVVDLQNNLVPPTQSDQGNWVIGAPVLSAAYR